MKIFQAIGDELSYKDILQLDGAFTVMSIKSPAQPSIAEWEKRQPKSHLTGLRPQKFIEI